MAFILLLDTVIDDITQLFILLFDTFIDDITSNGKTSLVHYRTLSFFVFRLKKKMKVRFFSWFQEQNHYRTCSLRYCEVLK
jgi:hypothetical protein